MVIYLISRSNLLWNLIFAFLDDDDDAIDVSTKADFDMMAWNKIKVLEVIIKDWIPKCMPHYVEDPNKWQSPDFHYFF